LFKKKSKLKNFIFNRIINLKLKIIKINYFPFFNSFILSSKVKKKKRIIKEFRNIKIMINFFFFIIYNNKLFKEGNFFLDFLNKY
jgi:hypothetical protein